MTERRFKSENYYQCIKIFSHFASCYHKSIRLSATGFIGFNPDKILSTKLMELPLRVEMREHWSKTGEKQ